METTLEPWASSLRDVKSRIRGLFTQEPVAASAGLFLDGLPGGERRKTGWMRAQAAGNPGPWRQQSILGRGRWDAEALRDIIPVIDPVPTAVAMASALAGLGLAQSQISYPRVDPAKPIKVYDHMFVAR